MKKEIDLLSIGFRLGQGVSALHRILVSLMLYKNRIQDDPEDEEDATIKNLINEIQEVIKKISL